MQQRITSNDAPMHLKMQVLKENIRMHEATRKNIKELMGSGSERQLAIECNMSQSTLHRFLKGETESLEFVHLQTLAHHFALTVSQLIGETPFDDDKKIRTVSLAMQLMPEYKKDVLVAASSSLTEPASNGTTGKPS